MQPESDQTASEKFVDAHNGVLEHSILADGYHSAIHRAGIKKGHALNSYVEMLNRISGSSTFYIRLRSTCLAEVEQLVAVRK